ncbi:SixA phosphatase family protein [Pedobacter sp. SL55]|uniref:SixA phosphatase family protein n=1 Tax=Pedobacter sp. SL55 TaxID=2995161 RepID=UPI00226E1954|nr:phosphoglycerate mutase family protein [Pedobacter sp. SL55]WAC41817.1 phosphoglycerate mutase family protein [Pedobacter sp. SL55]
MKKLLLLFVLALSLQQVLYAQKTLKVWVVRHAEKDALDPQDKDPDLSADGAKRAEALMKRLKGQKIDSIFVTDYKRTKLTGFPLADRIGISLKTYEPSKASELSANLKANAGGKKILIVGHSNTVLELIEAFGGKRPVAKLSDDDYDYIFELTIKGDKVDVKTDHYGEESRSKPGAEQKEMKM